MEITIVLQLRLDTAACVALAKAAAATAIVMALLSGHLTVADAERILRLLFGG